MRLLTALTLATLLTAAANAQAPAAAPARSPLDANRRAITLLERSLEAHGGRAMQQELKATIAIRGDVADAGQSLVALAPFESYPSRIDIRIDQPARKVRVESSSSIAGDFHFGDVTALREGKGFSLTPEAKSVRDVTNEPGILTRYLPHRTIAQALQNRASLRYVTSTANGDVLTYAIGGNFITLRLDKDSGLLREAEQILPMGIYGDGWRELAYEDYRRTGTLLLPARMRMRLHSAVHGSVENVYRYEEVKPSAEFTDGDFTIPAGYTKADYSYRGSFATKKLAENVYLLENVTETTGQWSYNVLVVVQDDGVLIAEAPVSSATSDRVIEKARELGGGKPIKYLVQSHHHNDHLGGIRSYIAEGATIVTGATAKPLIEKIATAPFHLDPDRLHRTPRAPKFEVVATSRTIGNVVIHNLGRNPHANDMLFIHLPKEGIVYQSDMVNEGEYAENAATRDFFTKLERLGAQWTTMVGLHGRPRTRPSAHQ